MHGFLDFSLDISEGVYSSKKKGTNKKRIKGGAVMVRAYDGSNLIKTIIINEQKTNELYNTLMGQMQDEKAKALFKKLAEDEARHEKIYTKLLDTLPNSGVVQISEEDAIYTETLISANVFTNDKVRKRFSKDDALILAEKVERDGIMFIEQLKNLYPDWAKNELSIILQEEKKHLQFVLEKQYTSTIGLLGL